MAAVDSDIEPLPRGVSAAASATSLQPTVSGGYRGWFHLGVLVKIRVTGHSSCQVCW